MSKEDRAWVKLTKRSPKMVRGLVASKWVVRLAGETCTRRIYEDWSGYSKGPVRLVLVVDDTKRPVERADLVAWEANEAKREAAWRAKWENDR